MAKIAPYHTTSTEYPPEHRNVYHDHSDCRDGKRCVLPRNTGSAELEPSHAARSASGLANTLCFAELSPNEDLLVHSSQEYPKSF